MVITVDRAERPDVSADWSSSGEEPLLKLRGISKRFGSVEALRDVDLDVPAGLVTALAGDNGAGKSVLIKAVAGIHVPDSGTIWWDGRPVSLRQPKDATALGIATVYQDLALCDNLDIVSNMYLGREKGRFGLVNDPSMEAGTKQTLADLGVTTVRSIHQRVGTLSGGQRQAIAIAKALLGKARLVIMDEPTAALGVTQTHVVLDLVRRLADQGIAVILISHNLNDVFAVADRIAVLHLGHMAAQLVAAETDAQTVVELMTTGRTHTAAS